MTMRRGEDRFAVRRNTQRYVCPKCGAAVQAPKMWVASKIHCDADGHEMQPMDDNQERAK